jgi:2-iminobutanoate/2-iminopropanoate deaminase
MPKRCMNAEGAPPAVGPYSHAVQAGNLLYMSGQLALNPDGSGLMKGTLAEETHQTFSNIKTVLGANGLSLDDVVKTTVFLDDMAKFADFNAIYAEYFTENPPARSCVEAAALPAGAQLEIEIIALFPEA